MKNGTSDDDGFSALTSEAHRAPVNSDLRCVQ